MDSNNPDDWNRLAAAWDEAWATHLSINTMRAGLQGPDQHIDAIRRFKEAVGLQTSCAGVGAV